MHLPDAVLILQLRKFGLEQSLSIREKTNCRDLGSSSLHYPPLSVAQSETGFLHVFYTDVANITFIKAVCD